MIDIDNNIHKIRLNLMSWILYTSPEDHGSYKEWLRVLRKKTKLEGNFSEDCCSDCYEQRMIDMFLLHFRHNAEVVNALLTTSYAMKPTILDLSHICEQLDRGELIRSSNSTHRDRIVTKEEDLVLSKLWKDEEEETSKVTPKENKDEKARTTKDIPKGNKDNGKILEGKVAISKISNTKGPVTKGKETNTKEMEMSSRIKKEKDDPVKFVKETSKKVTQEENIIKEIKKESDIKIEPVKRKISKFSGKDKSKKRKIEDSDYEDVLKKLSEETGRTISFLRKRFKAGMLAECPIYYPDHPEIPRYWHVDDIFAFDQLYHDLPEDDNPTRRAEIVQALIENGESIPLTAIQHRLKWKAGNPNLNNALWTRDETVRFLKLADETDGYESQISRTQFITKKLNTGRSEHAIRHYLQLYETCMESLWKPKVLPKYTEPLLKFVRKVGKSPDENSNETRDPKLTNPVKFKRKLGVKQGEHTTITDLKAKFTKKSLRKYPNRLGKKLADNSNDSKILQNQKVQKPLQKFTRPTLAKLGENSNESKDQMTNSLKELSNRTGRSMTHLRLRVKVGERAEKPIYYPDYPEIPRYWQVDDMYAFDNVYEKTAGEENVSDRAQKIKEMIKCYHIPLDSIVKRIEAYNYKGGWSLEERKKFHEIAMKYPASEYNIIAERVKLISEEMNTTRSSAAIMHQVKSYDICEESIRNPEVLPNSDYSIESTNNNDIAQENLNTSKKIKRMKTEI